MGRRFHIDIQMAFKMTDKARIKIEAAEWAYDKINVSAYSGYIAGATAEHERMAELNEKWKKEYQKLFDNFANHDAKINELQALLKQERNKAIDEVIELIPIALDSNMTLSEIIKALEYLKVKANES